MAKVSWSDLIPAEQNYFTLETGCGPGKAMFLIPQFIFRSSCTQHDFYYRRGGDIIDKFEADIMFLAYMLKDINNKYDKWYKKLFYTVMAISYFLSVSLFGLFFFTWGRYRSRNEILGI